MGSVVAAIHRTGRKLYKDSIPEQVDHGDLLQMNSTGLRSGLTGIVTRTVLLSRTQKLLENGEYGGCTTPCLIDLDNLRTLSDTHGYQAGDSALRKIGSTLREYKMKYEGIFGRYGGDELILALNDVDTAQEIHTILSEFVEKLNFSIVVKQKTIAVHYSIGACIWNKTDSLGALTARVDKALYDIK